MKNRYRKIINSILALALLLSMVFGVSASAEENDEEKLVKVTEADAIEMAERFMLVVCPNENLTGIAPIKFYDTSNQAIGYIVNIYNGNTPYGYVIIDSTVEGFISEYSLGENVESPYEVALQEREVSLLASQEKIYKLDMLTYGIYNVNNGSIETNTGECIGADSVISEKITRSGETHEWDDIFINRTSISLSYSLEEANYTDMFCAFSESYVENMTGKYACAVSAMGACADYFEVWDWNDFGNDYQRLWDLSGTYALKVENGIVYGSTAYYNQGPAFRTFCADKGLDINVSTTLTPAYSFFKRCINNGGIGVLGCNIKTESGDSGHAMAVEGYFQYIGKGTSTHLFLLQVADGWQTVPRYVNFGFTGYTYLNGVSFTL